MNFFGIDVNQKLQIRNLSILYSSRGFVILSPRLTNNFDLLDFYIALLNFLEIRKIDIIFGCFMNNWGSLVRIKVRELFYFNIQLDNIIYLLDGGNLEAYYEHRQVCHDFVGIEIRYKTNLSEDTFDLESIVSKIMRETEEQKKLIITKLN